MARYTSIRPIEDLESLRFLSQIKTQEEYIKKCNGPYLVGHIVDQKGFVCNRGTLLPRHIKIFDEIEQLDLDLGFAAKCEYKTFDQSYTPIGISQRTTAYYHIDYDDEDPYTKERQILRAYIAVSSNGTLFLKEEFTRGRVMRKFGDARLEEDAKTANALVKAVNYGIYLMPALCYHRSPEQQDDRPRTFLRLSK